MSEKQDDPINPSYYKSGGFEVADIADAYDLNRWLFTAVKYILRAGKKGDTVEDLKKSIWYIEREIKRLSK